MISTRFPKYSILAVCFAVCVGAISAAEDPYSPIMAENSNPRLKTLITLQAKDASLSEVLKALSERSSMNFVAGEGVSQEKITLILNKTPCDEAIDLLVRAAGLSYEIIGNSVLIAAQDKLKGEVGQSAYVVKCKYVDAEEVANILSDLTKFIKVDKGGNTLVCYTSPRVIREIERIVTAIDFPHVLVMLETRLIEVSMTDAENYGLNWANFSPIVTSIKYPESPLRDGLRADNWIQGPINFNLTLDMMIEDGKARVLMDSKLTTTNNREARLHIGDVIPYVIQSYNLSTAGGVNMQVQKEMVGVIVTMTPHINEQGQITLMLEPEVSSIVDWRGPNADIPHVRVRKTSTTVRVRDGQTVFLAGLLSEEKSESVKKFPVLGEIPLLGVLFQHRNQQVKRTNLIIEVTPRILIDSTEVTLLDVVEPVRGTPATDANSTIEKPQGTPPETWQVEPVAPVKVEATVKAVPVPVRPKATETVPAAAKPGQ